MLAMSGQQGLAPGAALLRRARSPGSRGGGNMMGEGARTRLESIASQGRAALGMFVGSSDASVTEVAASAGFDFVVIDCEHSPMDPLAATQHVRAAEATGILPFARLWDTSRS